MSRIGKKEIVIPSGVEIILDKGSQNSESSYYTLEVSGDLGKLKQKIPWFLDITLDNGTLRIIPKKNDKKYNSFWGLYRTLINNMIEGVSKGFEKELEIVGIGYRGEIKQDELILSLGYSHKIIYKPPVGVKITMVDQNNIKVFGFDKQKVGEVAAKIRSFRKPEPYKGKGIRYKGENVKRKSTKSTK